MEVNEMQTGRAAYTGPDRRGGANGPPQPAHADPGQLPSAAPGGHGYLQSGDAPSYAQQQSYPRAPSPYEYAQPQQQPQPQPASGGAAGLVQGMAGMDLGAPGAVPRTARRKGRAHAYHELGREAETAAGGALPAFNPNVASQLPSQFLDGASPGMRQYQHQQGGAQFPLPAAPEFAPAQAADPASFHHRGQGARQTGGGVDPLSIPSVASARDGDTAHYRTVAYDTLEQHLPPNACAEFVVQDQGNASPRFARLTLNSVPASSSVLTETSLPMALLLQPLAKPHSGEDVVPVLDFGEMGPPRCRRCRTYVNPFMRFSGTKFACNMCLFENNDVPPDYYAPMDMSGRRVDHDQRAELCRGTVEFVVPKEYWAKKEGAVGTEGYGGAPMRWLFLLDVTEKAVAQGALEAVVGGIREALYGESAYEPTLEGEEADDEQEGKKRRLPKGCKIGICTYDKTAHFYNLNPALEQPQMNVMSDIEEPFVPLSEGLFVDPYESRPVIEYLLDALPNIFLTLKDTEPALLPALRASLQALGKTGGKIICSLSSLPTWGPDRLIMREDNRLYNTDRERQLFQTSNPAWRTVAGHMVEAGIGVDFFMTPQNGAYVDVATVGHLSGTTGGENYLYPNFVPLRDSKKLREEISHAFHRETGYQAQLKVRCSNGLQVSAYHGNFLQLGGGSADVEFGAIDEDKALVVMFGHDGKLDPKVDAHFQSALLYTTKSGERRVRCSNVIAAVAETSKEVFRWVDQDAVLGVLAREATSRMTEKPLKEIRVALAEKCIEILASYRKHASSGNPPGQLVLPERLKEFSMLVLALMKARAFRGGSSPSDLRVNSARLLKSLPAAELQLYLYPRIIGIHNLSPEEGFPNANGYLKLPPAVRASYGFFQEGDVYLVDNGQYLLLWMHKQVSPLLLADLFGEGVESLRSLDALTNTLPIVNTLLNTQVRNIVQYLASQRGSRKLSIQLARQEMDGADIEFANALVEDRGGDERSYVDWLVHVHKLVQLEVTGQRKKDDEVSGGVMGIGAAGMGGISLW